jgi:HNH endonuclease
LRCIFCKQPSHTSTSVEHIVPHSLGNRLAILPRGVVCDRCNNYFSRKIEQPLLADRSFRNLRAWYQIPNKRGRAPSLHGFLAGTEVEIGLRLKEGRVDIQTERKGQADEFLNYLRDDEWAQRPSALLFERTMDPPKTLMSRLLAKMALESLSLRFLHDSKLIDHLIEDDHWEKIRRWARFGDNLEDWPYSYRSVFCEEALMFHPEARAWVQAGYSLDLFVTKRRETFLAFILYGHEFVINTGGPSTKGYEEWLKQQQGISPLVERLGMRLDIDISTSPPTIRLIGDAPRSAGIQFDLAQGIDGSS